VRLFLFKEASKLAVRRSDIVTAIGPDYRERKVTSAVLEEARKLLKAVFGYEVIEARKNVYILRSRFTPAEFGEEMRRLPASTGEKVHRERGLLLAALSLIFIAHGKINQDVLYLQLSQLGLGDVDERAWWV